MILETKYGEPAQAVLLNRPCGVGAEGVVREGYFVDEGLVCPDLVGEGFV